MSVSISVKLEVTSFKSTNILGGMIVHCAQEEPLILISFGTDIVNLPEGKFSGKVMSNVNEIIPLL